MLLGNAFYAEYRLSPERYSVAALELTPLGTTAVEAIITIEEQFGPAYRHRRCLNEPMSSTNFSYSAQAASHWLAPIPVIYYIYVYWCFDESGVLENIEAVKVGDGL